MVSKISLSCLVALGFVVTPPLLACYTNMNKCIKDLKEKNQICVQEVYAVNSDPVSYALTQNDAANNNSNNAGVMCGSSSGSMAAGQTKIVTLNVGQNYFLNLGTGIGTQLNTNKSQTCFVFGTQNIHCTNYTTPTLTSALK